MIFGRGSITNDREKDFGVGMDGGGFLVVMTVWK